MKTNILALGLVLILGITTIFGSTLAYFSDTDEDFNVMTVGRVSIDQFELERIDQTESGDEDNLQPYTQSKPLYPSVGHRTWASDAQPWPTGGSSILYGDGLKNVVDKFVFVENDGRNDAYVRTVFAFEAGDLTLAAFERLFHLNIDDTHWDWTHQQSGFIPATIGGTDYFVTAALYTGGILSPGDTARPSLLQYDLDCTATNRDMTSLGASYEILVISQAVQTDGFDNAATALDTAFGAVDSLNAAAWFEGILPTVVSTDAELAKALAADKQNIFISLAADVSADVSPSHALGGSATEKIVISGNGHTLTFNHLNSDWNHVATNNDAVLVLKDLHLTNSGRNDGPWNRHDIYFACDAELWDVTSDKAIALNRSGALKNVTITDDSGVYGLWIRANGGAVSIDGLTVNAERGIKIADEYIAVPAAVSLNVKNAVFNTAEKAAILVTSTAGAGITLEKVDLSGCAADPANAVWVDEDRAASLPLVRVTGGTAILERN